jgi:hypothetical protein
LLCVWSVSVGAPPRAVRPARAAQVNSYSTFGTVSYGAGSCGVDGTDGVVSAPGVKKILKVSNTEIYAVGCFTDFAGVAEADYLAKWNGTAWSGLGSSGDINRIVHDAVIYKGDLHIAGEFENAGGDATADMVARWSGTAWVGLAVAGAVGGSNGIGSPEDAAGETDFAAALEVQENGAGSSDDILLVGGRFINGINNGSGGGVTISNTRNIATWNGSVWGAVTGSSPYPSTQETEVVVRDIVVIGSDVYLGGHGYRNGVYSTTRRTFMFLRYRNSTTSWDRPVSTVSQPVFGSGFGIFTLEKIGTDIYVGGTFSGLSGVADNLAVYSTTGNTFSAFNSFAAQSGNGAVVRDVAWTGTQLFVGGSFAAVTGTSGGIARWTGSSWQGIGRNAPMNVNAVVADMLYNGTDSRIMIGSPSQNIGGVAAADGLATLAVSPVSTLDSVTVSSGTIAPAFDPAVVNYTVSLPNSSPSLAFTALASASGAPIVRSFSLGTTALDADTDVTINVAEGATETVTFLVTSVSGSSSTTYTFAVTRAAATTTSAAPTTAAPTTAAPTTAPPSTVGPQNTSPAPTQAPDTSAPATTAPATAAAGSGSSAAPVSVAPVVSSKKAATGSAIAKYAKITVAAGSRVSLKVASSSVKYCKVSGTSLKGVKAGSCRVTVTVTPKKGKAVSRTVTLKVT